MSESNPRRDNDNIGTEDDEDVEGTVPQVQDYPSGRKNRDPEGRETNTDEETEKDESERNRNR